MVSPRRDGPPCAIELRTTGRPTVIEVSGGLVSTSLVAAPDPALVLEGGPQLILGLISAHLIPAEARERGLRVDGDVGVLERLQPLAGSHGVSGAPSAPGRRWSASSPIRSG